MKISSPLAYTLLLAMTRTLAVSADSLLNELATTALTSAASNIGGTLGKDLTSWGLSALGIGQSTPDYSGYLKGIQSDLQQISNELNDIDNELNKVYDAININTCAEYETNSVLDSAITDVKNSYSNYQKLMQLAVKGVLSYDSSCTDQTMCPLAWADHVTQKMAQDLQSINLGLMGDDSSHGLFTACMSALPPPSSALNYTQFSEIDWWETQLYPMVNFYFILQTQAQQMMNEAYHIKAWQALGQPGGDSANMTSVISSVCNATTANGYTQTQVNSAIASCLVPYYTYQENTMLFIRNQLERVGAPVSKSLSEANCDVMDGCLVSHPNFSLLSLFFLVH